VVVAVVFLAATSALLLVAMITCGTLFVARSVVVISIVVWSLFLPVTSLLFFLVLAVSFTRSVT
jgi:hypothetical protein